MRLELFRTAFPDTPWLFLHREPLEILASHGASPAAEMVPQLTPPALFGLDPASLPGPDYEARVLARIVAAASGAAAGGGGLFVDYEALPDAVCAAILPHFGLACDPAERDVLAEVAHRNAKRPGIDFAADGAQKRAGASAEQRDAAERHLASVHAKLRALS